MRNSMAFDRDRNGSVSLSRLTSVISTMPRHFVIGIILILALIAFEMFNFDTTRYALQNLLGDVRFAGFAWATILAVAFCAIDFAGLARLFTPERGRDEPREIWYLTGAWLLGATMNALMTWWAVSLTLLNHDLGNEVMSREELLQIVPIFVALLVWLTRILFIGAVTAAGERILHFQTSGQRFEQAQVHQTTGSMPSSAPLRERTKPPAESRRTPSEKPSPPARSSRVRQRPPRPISGNQNRLGFNGIHTAKRSRR